MTGSKKNSSNLTILTMILMLLALATVVLANPSITLNSPINNSNSSGTNSTLGFYYNFTGENSTLTCALTNNGFGVGSKVSNNNTNDFIFSNLPLNEGQNVWNITCSDGGAILNTSTTYILTVDRTAPELSIQSPINNTIYENITSISLNYTAKDLRIDSCGYVNQTGATTLFANCANATIPVLNSDNNITVFANDTLGNLNLTQIFFKAKSTAPPIKIISLTTTSTATLNFSFEWNASINLTSQILNYSNTTLAQSFIVYFENLSASSAYWYNFTFCDSLNHCNFTNTTFTTASVPPSDNCNDGVQNQDETGIDCGGICNNKCGITSYGSGGGGGSVLTIGKYTLNLTEKKEQSVYATALDKVNLIFDDKMYVLIYSDVSKDGLTIRYYPTKVTMNFTVGKPTKTHLMNDSEDIEITINKIVENNDRFDRYGIKDYYINISAKRISLIEKPIIKPKVVEKNITPTVQAPLGPRYGKISVAAKNIANSSPSIITGSIIIGMILVLGLGIYLGLKKVV